MKCRGKPDTTWTIPRSIKFSPLHISCYDFMLYRGKSITFGTVHSDSACPRCFPLWKMSDSKKIYFTNIDLLQVLAAPAHGSVAVEYEETLLQFHCAPTHRLVGPPTLACLDGISWNGTVPHCQRRPEPTVSSGRRPTGGGQRLGGPPNGLLLVMAVVLQSMIKSR